MPLQWKDATSYSRGATERRPTAWSAQAGGINLTITCGHIHYPGVWLLFADPFYRERELLGISADDARGAQERAAQLVRERLQEALAAFGD